MRFQVRQRVFSLGDKFTIRDQDENDYFQVQGKVFSLGDKLSFQDMNGSELFYIEQKLLRLMAEYSISQAGSIVATCKQRFTFLGSKFDITSQYGNYAVEGKPLNYNYTIAKNGRTIATIDKRFFSLSDTYGIEIDDNEDYAFILCLVIVIDQVVHNDKNN